MSSKARGLADLGNAFDDGALSNRNMIINGGMVISQRNGGVSQSPAPSGYGIDRWATYKSGAGTFSIQQSTDGPSGFSNSALITVTSNSTPSGGDYYIFQHPIEGYNMSQLDWGASGAKDVTLSFWVKSSVTGTFGGSLRSSTGNYSYVFEYTVNSSSTWEYKSVNISGATVDTWNSTNGSGINLLFSLGQGTTYATSTVGSWTAGNFHSLTTETDLIASAGATWQITGVQLEVGDTATPFEHRSYGDELQKCRRFYQVVNHGRYNYLAWGKKQVIYLIGPIQGLDPQIMRASPSSSYGTSTGAAYTVQRANIGGSHAISTLYAFKSGAVYLGGGSTFTNTTVDMIEHNSGSGVVGFVQLDAEL
jgi:hypothetical protein